MNPVLIILVLIGAALLWLLCSFLFRPIGKVSQKLIDDAKTAMFEGEDEDEDEDEEKEKEDK